MDTFSPSQPPSYDGNSIKETPRLISVNFGDGYKLTAPDGLNANDATAQFTWSNVTEELDTYIRQFYLSHIGKTFLWDAPNDKLGSGKWAITGLQYSEGEGVLHNITLSLERRFDF